MFFFCKSTAPTCFYSFAHSFALHDALPILFPDARPGMDFDAGQESSDLRDRPRRQLPIPPPSPMRQAMQHDRMKARVAERNLQGRAGLATGGAEIGRAHVRHTVHNAQLVCRLLLATKNEHLTTTKDK